MRWPDLSEYIHRVQKRRAKAYTSHNPKICFAWFPKHKGSQWIWWEYYAKYYYRDGNYYSWRYQLIAPEDQEQCKKK